ncbi:TonB-linked SusC/RagA family outer membrane protein [Dyadobacter sp. BE34]|uniref:TonB-linked SusC/RagA family outer membrane protein n=1 Tax=Dyadobacter fermentans TaxID=94254 RepID=A0ABU1R4U5_9BACT|nr:MULTISPECIES: SusC/RagA family TonB-linked outer membrane protein [Dyadobacter]MDR6808410.1 TonB-linked SusC/RagA family outer membrane protein [Dyadobacter fermentans]MDR7045773.1 TonB-linked SusC/RagA family outer membrane protein [Dyadobacter sp. BE242]MDR7200086.1 TonB-linked SusC/RagA family outer membrane protein [Dyadobacter sp. BE34]MDR7218046.1 TonB-linked SusC/RagA family outer membrane protein [Dyadobacter sp. BE31]MDR7265977.1 TonB-linked SusC/RagA family outer membrane protein 
MRRLLLCIFVAVLLVSPTFAARNLDKTIKGKVTSKIDGAALPGVSIVVKGSQLGTSSDASGNYSINVNEASKPVLVFSYIGHETQEVVVGNQSVIDVVLAEGVETLNETVVTALGLSREKRSLGYSVAEVNGKDISRVAQENVLNSLAGRVPGVTISSTGGTGSSVSMIIRGATSLSSDNQPLFVVDGVPIANTLNNVSQVGNDNRVDYGNAISSLNPDDIENVSILKGPNAAALYGSRAGRGVVLITTKNGSKSKKMTVSVNSNTVFDKPYKYLNMHHKFATGILPFTPDNNPYPGGVLMIDEGSAGGVGPELDKGYKAIQWNSPKDANGNPIPTELVSHPDNVKNFVRTGITTTNGVAISNSNDLVSYRLSYSNMTNRGIIPNSDLFRNSLNINSAVKLTKKLTLSTNVDISRNNSNNRPATNRGTNPLQWAYAVSPHIDIRDLRNYWVPGQEGLQQLSQGPGDYNNPWFLAYEVNNSFVRDRVFGNVKADWQITPHLSLMGRYALDTYREQRETKIGNSYTNDSRGGYGVINLSRFERNADFLLSYKRDINNFSFSVSGGGNTRYQKNMDLSTASGNGTGLVIPGLYTLSNIAPQNLRYSSYLSERAVFSAYGLANIGFKDMVYLDLTARNDWSSTLPKANRSYFYPSASLSVLLNEMFRMPNQISLFKARGSWAQVGNDTQPYNLLATLGNSGAWDGITRLSKSGQILLPDLKPEIATSYEYGLDLNLYHNRVRLTATYYQVENRNQIIPTKLPGSSGYSSKNINAGLLVSKGLEFTLGGTPIDKNGWRWDINANWSRNRTTIKSLSDGLEFYTLWTDAKGGAWTYVGEQIGDIYDAELVTVKDKSSPYYGYPILDENGSWQSISASKTRNKIGNFNPDFLLGLQTSLSYKGFTLNMSFDWRQGGNFVSQTYRYGESDLKSQRFLDNLINPNGMTGDQLRNYLVDNNKVAVTGNKFNIVGGPTKEYGGFPFEYGGNTYDYAVFNPGVIAQYNEAGEITGYTENLGGAGTKYIPYGDNYPWDFTRAATFDASFVKLREVSLGYDLPSKFVKRIGLQNANIAVYSRNIILWTKAKIGIDPEQAFQQESGTQAGTQFKQGIERYNVTPWVIPVGFRLGLTF